MRVAVVEAQKVTARAGLHLRGREHAFVACCQSGLHLATRYEREVAAGAGRRQGAPGRQVSAPARASCSQGRDAREHALAYSAAHSHGSSAVPADGAAGNAEPVKTAPAAQCSDVVGWAQCVLCVLVP